MHIKKVKPDSTYELLKPTPLALFALDIRFQYAESQLKQQKDKK